MCKNVKEMGKSFPPNLIKTVKFLNFIPQHIKKERKGKTNFFLHRFSSVEKFKKRGKKSDFFVLHRQKRHCLLDFSLFSTTF